MWCVCDGVCVCVCECVCVCVWVGVCVFVSVTVGLQDLQLIIIQRHCNVKRKIDNDFLFTFKVSSLQCYCSFNKNSIHRYTQLSA